MPLKEYGVLVGRPIAKKLGAGQSPHYQIHVVDDTTHYRIAVNVKSKLAPSELLYLVAEDFRHPILEAVSAFEPGFHLLGGTPDSGALDFIRGNLFDRADLRPLPFNVPGPDNDLNEKIDAYVSRLPRLQQPALYREDTGFGFRCYPSAKKDRGSFGTLSAARTSPKPRVGPCVSRAVVIASHWLALRYSRRPAEGAGRRLRGGAQELSR